MTKNILLISDVFISTDGGSLLLDRTLKLFDGNKLEFYFQDSRLSFFCKLLVRISFCRISKRIRSIESLSFIYIFLYYKLLVKVLYRDLSRIYSSGNIDIVVTSSNDILPLLGSMLSKDFGAQYHVMFQDLPQTFKVSSREKKIIISNMKIWTDAITSYDAVSDEMNEYLKKQTSCNVKNFVNYGSVGFNNFNSEINCTSPIVSSMCFIGSPRFKNEMQVFIDGVERAFGDSVHISSFSRDALPFSKVKNEGYFHDQDQLIEVLSKFDLAYVPLSFKKEDKLLVSTSFPSKIQAYLRAGVPIFAHGPKYATNVIFVNKYQVGISCTEMNPEKICQSLVDYANNFPLRKIHAENTLKVVSEKFDRVARKLFYSSL